MKKIKEPSVANSFYSGNTAVLNQQIKEFEKENSNKYTYKTRAVIVPHAGLVYSGQLAYEGISQLDKDIKNIFIFAPAHRVGFLGLALTGFDEWKTPLGNIEINHDINNELINKFNAQIFDDAHREEHSIEIQLPIIQSIFKDVKIIPVLVGKENPQTITNILNEYYNDKTAGFIISSDLSHFLTDSKACELDNKTALMIESGNIENFRFEQACGAIGIVGLVDFANQHDYSLIRINMLNSSSATGDKSRVVGYGCWFLYENNKNTFLKEYYSDYILDICRKVIQSRFSDNLQIPEHTQIFNEYGACFVTLKKENRLRGCIGSIIAHQPLIRDLIHNAQNAAFHDPRFNPVKENEVDELEIDVSILTSPKPIHFKNETDLLNQIVPFKDGIIIKDGMHQAVYLPSVWEELSDKELFLKSLKVKAGMSPNHFSPNFEAFRFETVYIQ